MAEINEAIKPWKRNISQREWDKLWVVEQPTNDNPKVDWRALAVDLYFTQHGRRCVNCSKPVEADNAKIVTRDGVHYLFHATNCA